MRTDALPTKVTEVIGAIAEAGAPDSDRSSTQNGTARGAHGGGMCADMVQKFHAIAVLLTIQRH